MEEKNPGGRRKRSNLQAGGRRLLVLTSLALVIILASILYSQRHRILQVLTGSNVANSDPGVASLHLPPGFQASVFFSGLKSPRFISFGPRGELFVAERGSGRIVAVLATSDIRSKKEGR